jgi:hypothetical protein
LNGQGGFACRIILDRYLATGSKALEQLNGNFCVIVYDERSAQVVLATAKNYSHRSYIGKGYYAEVTLIYSGGDFRPLDWTYPDYRGETALTFFRELR